MALDLNTVVDAIHPASGVNAVLVGDQVWVIFDQEVDESSVQDGNFFVTGPDNDTWSGPDLALWQNPNGSQLEDEILGSPGYAGVVKGTYTFERISLADTSIVTTPDVIGDGTLYRTKAIFTPDTPLSPDTKWTVYLLGDEDESDELKTGVKPRSVFDTEHAGSGSEEVYFFGSYSGELVSDVVNAEIVTSGVKGTATFKWWLSSAPATVYGPTLIETEVFLKEGVYVNFGAGVFETGDEYTSVLKRIEPFIGSFVWPFETGSGSIQTIPTTTATSVIGNLVPVTSSVVTSSSVPFQFSSIEPEDRATNLDISTNQIIITFSKDVDPSTVTSDRIRLMGLPVNGDPDILSERTIYKDVTVSGNKIILDF